MPLAKIVAKVAKRATKKAAPTPAKKPSNVKVIKPGTKPLTPRTSSPERSSYWNDYATGTGSAKPKKVIQNSRKAPGVSVNNKGTVSSGAARTSKSKIKSGS
jgi:hypothetical protein